MCDERQASAHPAPVGQQSVTQAPGLPKHLHHRARCARNPSSNVELRGESRASYGEQLITNLAARLGPRFGRGMSVTTLRRIRRFYLTYPNGTTIPRDVAKLEIRSTA